MMLRYQAQGDGTHVYDERNHAFIAEARSKDDATLIVDALNFLDVMRPAIERAAASLLANQPVDKARAEAHARWEEEDAAIPDHDAV